MSRPLPEIPEAQADGQIAAIYADIRDTQRLGLVNLIWRHLATRPDALEWVWQRLRPVYATGAAAQEAHVLGESLLLPRLAPVPAAAFHALGLSEAARASIISLIDTYNRGNSLNLVALSALNAEPEPAHAPKPEDVGPPENEPPPPIPALCALDPEVRALVLELNRFGTQGARAPIVASLYRHLGLWPAYLAFAWAQLAPSALDGSLDETINSLRDTTRPYARRAATVIDTGVPAPSREIQHFAEQAIEYFLATAIARMVPIGLMLKRTLQVSD